MRTPIILFIGLIFTFFLTGCSVKMAARQEVKENFPLLTEGQKRDDVISSLGQPDETYKKGDRTFDVYFLNRGSKYAGYSRAAVYGALDVVSLGLWELIGTPLEKFIQAEDEVMIEYDANKQVTRITGS